MLEQEQEQLLVDISPKVLGSDLLRRDMKAKIFVGLQAGTIDPRPLIAIWFDFFQGLSFSSREVYAYREDYWPWFVEIGWSHVSQIDDERIVPFMVRTCGSAIRQFVDVPKEYVFLLLSKSEEQQMHLHKALGEQLLKSTDPLGLGDLQSSRFTMQDVIAVVEQATDIDDVSRYDRIAEFEKILFSSQIVGDDADLRTGEVFQMRALFDFLSIFIKHVPVDRITESYFDLLREKVQSDMDEQTKIILGAKIVKEMVPESVTKDTEDTTQNSDMAPENIVAQVSAVQSSLSTVYQTAQRTFGTDLETIDMAALLAYLDTEASTQGDDRIRDLVRFNEQARTFEWNTDLLSQK